MHILPKEYINEAREFQRYGGYDLAINSLKQAQQADKQHEYEVEINKLMSFNYRKLKEFDLALFHINSAIRSTKSAFDRANNKPAKKEYAICLMNKGVIYEEKNNSDKATTCYLQAIDLFTELFDSDPENYGIIINALLTIGTHYYKQKQDEKAKEFLQRAIPYFDNECEKDRRYWAIVNTLSEIDKK